MAMLFSPRFRRRTWLNAIYLFVSNQRINVVGSAYVPRPSHFSERDKALPAIEITRLSSYATILLSIATILGCLALPPLAERYGRRWTLAVYFFLMFVSIALGFGYAYYLQNRALEWFLASLMVLGFGGANFTMYALWIPEQYPTECRASAFGFATSVGRFLAAAITFLEGWMVDRMHTIGIPVALTSLFFLAENVFLLPWGMETKGQELPD